MEETKAEQQLLPHDCLCAALEEHGVRDGVIEVGAQKVGPEPFGGLVGHFDPILEDADWKFLCWIAG